jgi:hypothetical protein
MEGKSAKPIHSPSCQNIILPGMFDIISSVSIDINKAVFYFHFFIKCYDEIDFFHLYHEINLDLDLVKYCF